MSTYCYEYRRKRQKNNRRNARSTIPLFALDEDEEIYRAMTDLEDKMTKVMRWAVQESFHCRAAGKRCDQAPVRYP